MQNLTWLNFLSYLYHFENCIQSATFIPPDPALLMIPNQVLVNLRLECCYCNTYNYTTLHSKEGYSGH